MKKTKIYLVAVAILVTGAIFSIGKVTHAAECGDPGVVCSNGPVIPLLLGWIHIDRGTDITATPDNCPRWYGLAGCMRNTNAK